MDPLLSAAELADMRALQSQILALHGTAKIYRDSQTATSLDWSTGRHTSPRDIPAASQTKPIYDGPARVASPANVYGVRDGSQAVASSVVMLTVPASAPPLRAGDLVKHDGMWWRIRGPREQNAIGNTAYRYEVERVVRSSQA